MHNTYIRSPQKASMENFHPLITNMGIITRIFTPRIGIKVFSMDRGGKQGSLVAN